CRAPPGRSRRGVARGWRNPAPPRPTRPRSYRTAPAWALPSRRRRAAGPGRIVFSSLLIRLAWTGEAARRGRGSPAPPQAPCPPPHRAQPDAVLPALPLCLCAIPVLLWGDPSNLSPSILRDVS
ncbi:MAG: hypothetical protein AVDCRST_MAG68-3616, partial [uncultured Gemmatimonadetes bacterium]